jgi:hypothetical protein
MIIVIPSLRVEGNARLPEGQREDQTQTQKRKEDTEGRNRLAGVEGRKGG